MEKKLFVLSQWAPFLLYYSGFHSEPEPHGPTFPATISHTIRKGIPKWGHHCFWFIGWYKVLKALEARGAGLGTKLRCAFAFSQGVAACVIFGLSHDKVSNQIHAAAAALYMYEHLFLMKLFRHSQSYVSAFKFSFLAFCASLVALRVLEMRYEIPGEVHNTERREAINSLSLPSRAIVYFARYVFSFIFFLFRLFLLAKAHH